MNDPQNKYRYRKGQSFSAFVRFNLAVIAAEQEAGFSLEYIFAEIRQLTGTTKTFGGFRTTLNRARTYVRKNPPPAPLTLPDPIPAPAPSHTTSLSVHTGATSGTYRAGVRVVGGVPNAQPVRTAFEYQPAQAKDDLADLLGTGAGSRR